MKYRLYGLCLLGALGTAAVAAEPPLGLPPLPIPENNPLTEAKIQLGEKLFLDKRFSATGDISCSTCHDPEQAFTDAKVVSEGINALTGTRNAPTVINAAYFPSQFWDGRSPSLEDQAQHPMINPVEMGLENHDPVLSVIAEDADYQKAFEEAFGVSGEGIRLDHVLDAIASFERTVIAGDSPFDRYYFGGDKTAMTDAQIRGFEVFLNQGRCVSCHTIEQDFALFTDGRFHNIGVGINDIQEEVPRLASAFLKAKVNGADVDKEVLTDAKSSELGRFAVTDTFDDMGAFKTSTLRNIAVTAPYMHDGSLETLREVVEHYNNGGKLDKEQRVNDFLSGGIRPLNLSEQQIDDLVAFLEALTSPQFENVATAATAEKTE